MNGRFAWLAILFALSGCARCASQSAPDAGRLRQKNPLDARTALLTVFPEVRGAFVTGGFVSLTRESTLSLPEGSLLADTLGAAASAKGFTVTDGGATDFSAARPPFALSARRDADRLTVAIRLPLDGEGVGRLYQSPTPLTSETLADSLPDFPAARPLSERFQLSLDYVAVRESRADFLVRQLVDMLTAGRWAPSELPRGWEPGRRPDGGVGGVPPKFALTLTRGDPAAELQLDRDGARVHVELRQPTWP